MDNTEKKKLMLTKIATQTTDMLLLIASGLKDNFQEGSCLVFNDVLDELQKRLPEQEFVMFCNLL